MNVCEGVPDVLVHNYRSIAFRRSLLDEAIRELSDRPGASSHRDLYLEDEVHMVIYVICPYNSESLLAHVL